MELVSDDWPRARRHGSRPNGAVWVTVTKVAVAVLLCAFVAIGLFRATVSTGAPPDQRSASEVYQQVIDGHDHSRCAQYGADRQPGTRALVRTPAGKVRIVSFKQAWAIYTGDRPGAFLELCVGH